METMLVKRPSSDQSCQYDRAALGDTGSYGGHASTARNTTSLTIFNTLLADPSTITLQKSLLDIHALILIALGHTVYHSRPLQRVSPAARHRHSPRRRLSRIIGRNTTFKA